MLHKIRVISEDQFSGATMTKEIEVNDKNLTAIEGSMLHGTIHRVFSKKEQIAYNWKIVEVERLN